MVDLDDLGPLLNLITVRSQLAGVRATIRLRALAAIDLPNSWPAGRVTAATPAGKLPLVNKLSPGNHAAVHSRACRFLVLPPSSQPKGRRAQRAVGLLCHCF